MPFFFVFEDCPDVLDNVMIVDAVSPSLSKCHEVTQPVMVELPFTYHVTGFKLTPNAGNLSMTDITITNVYYSAIREGELKQYNNTWTAKVHADRSKDTWTELITYSDVLLLSPSNRSITVSLQNKTRNY